MYVCVEYLHAKFNVPGNIAKTTQNVCLYVSELMFGNNQIDLSDLFAYLKDTGGQAVVDVSNVRIAAGLFDICPHLPWRITISVNIFRWLFAHTCPFTDFGNMYWWLSSQSIPWSPLASYHASC